MRFSIIIPVYNAEKTLKKCLDSVLAQTFCDWQAIVINDGSVDESSTIMSEYAEKDSRIFTINQENMGPGLTRNRGIKIAEGDYIVCLDSDDYVDTTFLEEVNEKATKDNKDVDVVFLDLVFETINGGVIRIDKISSCKDYDKTEFVSCQMTGKIPWGGCRKVVNREFLAREGIEFSSGVVGEEALYSFRIMEFASSVSFVDKALYHYVEIPTSQSKKGKDDPWGAVVDLIYEYLVESELYEKYEKALNSFGVTAITVSCNRIANNYSFGEARRKIKEKICSYKYSFDIERSYVTKKVSIIYRLLRIKAISAIIILAKIKKMLRR